VAESFREKQLDDLVRLAGENYDCADSVKNVALKSKPLKLGS
jgi:hypothetical protein